MKDYANQITTVLIDCFYRGEEIKDDASGQPILPEDAVIIEGMTMKFGLHPDRVKAHAAEIHDLIAKIVADDFLVGKGGGYTFLNLCMDRDGEHWGEHKNCEELIVLGMAVGRAGYCLPREVWSVLPGSVPYVWFSNTDKKVVEKTEERHEGSPG